MRVDKIVCDKCHQNLTNEWYEIPCIHYFSSWTDHFKDRIKIQLCKNCFNELLNVERKEDA